MKQLLETVRLNLEEENPLVLVTIVASSGSTPRGSGARMVIGAEGRLCGTIGGGAVEYEAQRIAAGVLEEKKSCLRDYRLTPNQVADLGMICGGSVCVYFQYLPGNDRGLLELFEAAIVPAGNGAGVPDAPAEPRIFLRWRQTDLPGEPPAAPGFAYPRKRSGQLP